MEMYSSSYIRKWTLFCWIYDSNRGLNLHVDASWYSDFPQPSSTYLLSFAKFQVGLDADCCLDSSSFQPKRSSLWVSSYLLTMWTIPSTLDLFFFFCLVGLVGWSSPFQFWPFSTCMHASSSLCDQEMSGCVYEEVKSLQVTDKWSSLCRRRWISDASSRSLKIQLYLGPWSSFTYSSVRCGRWDLSG